MYRARAMVSAPGAQPDLEGSLEVLTWMWTPIVVVLLLLLFSGLGFFSSLAAAERKAPRALSRSPAFLLESMLLTAKRLGILARDLQWEDCRPPMKCQWMEGGRRAALAVSSCA